MGQNKHELTPEQIQAMCQRGFGNHVQMESMHDLHGGTFNTAYIITLHGQQKVVLRVAPPHTPDTYWEEAFLMRREHAMQPFFAPVAAWMPKMLLVDFTHQLIDRDYMFQSFLEGERWDHIVDELTAEENGMLWNQFGAILRQVHNVQGEEFGLPLPGLRFPSWSQTIIDRLERTLRTARERQLEIPHLTSILKVIRMHPQPLDEIRVPRLLHGDLWLFNILVRREAEGPVIAGVLDADRSWWGDPMADWTMFILAHAEPEDGHSRFWQAYGTWEDTPGSQFRRKVYDAMHAATALLWAVQHKDEATVDRARVTLAEVVTALSQL